MLEGVKGFFTKKEEPIAKGYDPFIEIGESGTDLADGYLSVDYNNELQGQEAISQWDKMRKTDSTIRGLSQAVKLPLLSANWFIQPASEDDKDKEIAEFISWNMFEGRKTTWAAFLNELLEYRNFGFYYFEKVFTVMEDGLVAWSDFAARQPSAHLAWKMENGEEGIQQQLPSINNKDNKSGNLTPSIPWSKLIYFVNDREGDNYEGVSVLRYCRQLWKYKQKMLKIIAVNAERYGIGLPVITLESMNQKDIALAEDFAKNIRANGKSYMILPKGMEVSLLTPERDIVGDRMENSIDFYNKEIMRAYLASFLGLGDGGGSFALSKSLNDFFMLSLESIAKNVKDELNKHIRELVDLNWADVEEYPTIEVTEIAKKDIEAFTGMIETLSNTGFISAGEKKITDYVREELNLPEITDEDFENQEIEKEETEEEEKAENKEETEEKEEMSEGKDFFLADTPLKEQIFQESISKQEKFLQDTYNNEYVALIELTEQKIKKYLTKEYKKLDTEMRAGELVIKRSGNQKNKTRMMAGVKNIMNKFDVKLKSDKFMGKVFKKSMNNALGLIKDVEKRTQLADFIVSQGEFNSFITGYKSNMQGVVFNEGRRVQEKINDNLTQGASMTLSMDQVSKISFNKNIYKLSAVTHPRALFKRIVELKSDTQGITHYKSLVPTQAIAGLAAFGMTALALYQIKSKREWNQQNGTEANVNVVGGMGSHHGDQTYFMPVSQDEMEEQEAISTRQRQALEEELNK